MRQRANCNCRACRPLVIEETTIGFVETRVVVHVHEKSVDFNNVGKRSANAAKHVSNVSYRLNRLLVKIEDDFAVLTGVVAGEGPVGSARTDARDEGEITYAFDMRETAKWLRLGGEHLVLD